MTELLNLDEIESPVEKTIVIKGVRHSQVLPTVRELIENTRLANKLEKVANSAEHIELLVKLIGSAFPTIPRDDLVELNLLKLQRILDFINESGEGENKSPRGE